MELLTIGSLFRRGVSVVVAISISFTVDLHSIGLVDKSIEDNLRQEYDKDGRLINLTSGNFPKFWFFGKNFRFLGQNLRFFG